MEPNLTKILTDLALDGYIPQLVTEKLTREKQLEVLSLADLTNLGACVGYAPGCSDVSSI